MEKDKTLGCSLVLALILFFREKQKSFYLNKYEKIKGQELSLHTGNVL
jgi:hypothetical protein